MEWLMWLIIIGYGIYGLVCDEASLTPAFLLSFFALILIWVGLG